MSKFTQRLEVFSNIAIIVVSLLFGGILIQRYFFPVAGNSSQAEIKIGTNLKVAGVDFSKADKTLVLALSNTCHYCSESAPFYRKIAAEAANTNTQLVAALPQTVSAGKDYLQKLEIPINEVKQVSLEELNVSGTPTLILLDKEGKVVNYWVGKLPPVKETDVLANLKS